MKFRRMIANYYVGLYLLDCYFSPYFHSPVTFFDITKLPNGLYSGQKTMFLDGRRPNED